MRKALLIAFLAASAMSGCKNNDTDVKKAQHVVVNDAVDEPETNFRKGVALLQKGDHDNAARYLRLAADKGHQFAQFKLGSLFENGNTGKVDFKESFRWYQLAARQGHALAQAKLGSMYRYGSGTDIDYTQSKAWYSIASQNGNKEATAALAEMSAEESGGTMAFLNSFAGKYPHEVKLLDHPVLSKRLSLLTGERFNFMKQSWAVESPMEITNGKFIASGCMAHNCASTNFIVIYDFNTNTLYVGIRENDVVSRYSENGYTCDELQRWGLNG
ncbi:MAG TPA: hypothetical protein VN371_09630 [Chlorobaculum sp.]|nr:hypothetical protein [Chlorobaculum sp.]